MCLNLFLSSDGMWPTDFLSISLHFGHIVMDETTQVGSHILQSAIVQYILCSRRIIIPYPTT